MYLQDKQEEAAVRWMHAAGEVAKRALCLRAKCGTVIVKNGEIIGEGYNAPPLDMEEHRTCHLEFENPGKPKYDRTCCMHAEWRAVLDASGRNPEKLPGSTLYFMRIDSDGNMTRAGEPFCTVCSRFALDAGVATFCLWQEEGIRAYPTGEYNKISYAYVHPEAL